MKTILSSAALDAKENISTCSHVAILWCRPIASGLCSSTFPIVHPTSYTPLSSGCCSTLMHALFRRCIHSLFMSWSIDVNRPRSVSEHVAMAESESGGQTKYMLPVRSFQKNIVNRTMQWIYCAVYSVRDVTDNKSFCYDRLWQNWYTFKKFVINGAIIFLDIKSLLLEYYFILI